MNIKSLFIVVSISLPLFACNNSKETNTSEQETSNTVIIEQESTNPTEQSIEIEESEETATEQNASEEDLRVMFQGWLDKEGIFKHAPELSKLMDKVNNLATKQGSEVGYFDWDVWQETQDMPGKEIVNKAVMLTENTAVVSVTIDDGYRPTERSVILSKESGKWKVVDFVSSSGKSFKVTCVNALEELENN